MHVKNHAIILCAITNKFLTHSEILTRLFYLKESGKNNENFKIVHVEDIKENNFLFQEEPFIRYFNYNRYGSMIPKMSVSDGIILRKSLAVVFNEKALKLGKHKYCSLKFEGDTEEFIGDDCVIGVDCVDSEIFLEELKKGESEANTV